MGDMNGAGGGSSMPSQSPGTNRDFGNMLNEKIKMKKAPVPGINKRAPHFSPWTKMAVQQKDTVK